MPVPPVGTALGPLEVSCANDGSAPLAEHADVHLAWARDVARLVAPKSATSHDTPKAVT